YEVTLTSVNGCDSIVTTNISFLDVLTSSEDVEICTEQSYTLPVGTEVSTAGSYEVTLTSTNGCDSIVTTNISVLDVLSSSEDVEICTGQTFTLPDGTEVSTAGSYDITLTSVNGCDSIVTTNLSVLDVLSSSED